MTQVTLDGLVKRYNRVAVVDGASLEAHPGELTLVLGPSGAGKTTLARLIAGLERPDAGEIYFDGRVVHNLPASQRRVGLVFQDDSLWPHMTVLEIVAYGLSGRSRRDRKTRAAEILAELGLDGLADRRPSELTGLQRRRVALARALATEPEVLLIDEPLAPLESRVRAEFREDLRRLPAAAERTTIVFTHEPTEAMALADRVAILDLGRFIQVGAPRELYERPIDAFVAQFLGATNLIQGQIDSPENSSTLIVRTPLGRLVGTLAHPTVVPGPGAPVTISIRPESMSIGPPGTADANRISATLERRTFLGPISQLAFRGPGDWPLTTTCLHREAVALREGQSMTLSIPPEQVVVLLGRYASAG